jgi:hypothetical protein
LRYPRITWRIRISYNHGSQAYSAEPIAEWALTFEVDARRDQIVPNPVRSAAVYYGPTLHIEIYAALTVNHGPRSSSEAVNTDITLIEQDDTEEKWMAL